MGVGLHFKYSSIIKFFTVPLAQSSKQGIFKEMKDNIVGIFGYLYFFRDKKTIHIFQAIDFRAFFFGFSGKFRSMGCTKRLPGPNTILINAIP